VTAFGPTLPTVARLAGGVRRVIAPNPSLMTGPGTNSYLFGDSEVAVLDPGPLIASHLECLQEEAGAPILWILVTHTHPDHSPGAVELARQTGAELLGMPAPEGKHQDKTFVPDRILSEGDRLVVDDVEIEVIHTPGHASNHLCYRQLELNWLFTGDHVIDGSTVVINPPDGNMSHYLQSLQKLKLYQVVALAPGHGDVIDDPDRAIDWIIDHRLEREAKVVAALSANPNLTSHELVPFVYKDVDERLYGWAERSLLAHLLKLVDDGKASRANDRWVTT